MRLVRHALIGLAIATSASAQSFNIDFGSAGSTPAATYGAAGSIGTWNVIGVLPAFERHSLVDTQGNLGSAQIYMFGGSSLSILVVDDPGTSGEDAALLDDMLIGLNDPVDVCVWIEGLELGEYEVITYALTPGEPARGCRVVVDFANQGADTIGGVWPGQMLVGTTHARHTVTTTNGRIGLHSGLYNGFFQSGINGVQVRPTALLGVGPASRGGSQALMAAPNPASAAQWLSFSGALPSGGSVSIHDVTGREVWSSDLQAVSGGGRIAWSGRDAAGQRVAPGVYLARWRDGDGRTLASARLARVR